MRTPGRGEHDFSRDRTTAPVDAPLGAEVKNCCFLRRGHADLGMDYFLRDHAVPSALLRAARACKRRGLFHFGTTSWPFVRTPDSTMAISTRRLAARACSLLPGIRGSDLPNPLVLMMVAEIPVCTRKSRTASARRRESCKL